MKLLLSSIFILNIISVVYAQIGEGGYGDKVQVSQGQDHLKNEKRLKTLKEVSAQGSSSSTKP